MGWKKKRYSKYVKKKRIENTTTLCVPDNAFLKAIAQATKSLDELANKMRKSVFDIF